MSSISAAAPFMPPAPVPAADNGRAQHKAAKAETAEKADRAAEKAAQKVSELTATAVAAESIKDSRKGGVLDIRV